MELPGFVLGLNGYTCALFALAVVPDTEYTFICPVCRTVVLSVHLVPFELVMMLTYCAID